ncbi:MAG: PH domain-containing protein [Microbacteriaceae bacterium]|nr:PH domain-containing protein [Microbacteriaceae bacterium]MCL2794092.1 PH domain-containing protein [Microbacteriaceae bacterium]
MRVTEESKTLRSRFGLVLTVLVWCVCAASLVAIVATGRWADLARYGALALLVAYVMWLLFWSPSVTIAISGVQVRNVLRVHDVTWPAIKNVDTKYALTLVTTAGKITSWAAPAPSRYATMRASRTDAPGLPQSTFMLGTIRPSDVPSSDSGIAALYVRRYWDELREAGHLDSGAVEGTGVVTHWLGREAAVLVALAIAAAACVAFVR